jgi:hypothetical protein
LIEAKVAAFAREFLAIADDADQAVRQEAQRWLASGLSRLLDDLLATDERWDSQYRWIDGFLVFECSARSDGQIDITGSIVWGKRGLTQQWIDPCRVSLRASSHGLEAYAIRFGDAARDDSSEYPGVSKQGFPVTEPCWRFVFEKRAARLSL